MREMFLLVLLSAMVSASRGQQGPTVTIAAGTPLRELQAFYSFEGINLQRVTLRGTAIHGKNYQLVVKEFTKGKLSRIDTVFNARVNSFFRIHSDSLQFSVLARTTDNSEWKLQFQFTGYAVTRHYTVVRNQREKFALKSFQGPQPFLPLDLRRKTYLLAYMTPYVRADHVEEYCEVAQSGLDPEKLYDRFKIPQYFLIEIDFDAE